MPKKTTNKENTNGFTEFSFEGENGNAFSGRIYPKNGGNENADIFPLSMTVNGLAIVGCKLIDGKNGAFVSFPQYKTKNGEYKAQCYFYDKSDMKDCSDLADYLIKLISN